MKIAPQPDSGPLPSLRLVPAWSRTSMRHLVQSPGWLALTPTARLIYHTLWVHADSMGRDCFPSVPKVASEAGVSVRTCQRALRELEDAGAIDTEQRQSRPGDNSTSLYLLTCHPLVSPVSPSVKSTLSRAAREEQPDPVPSPSAQEQTRTTQEDETVKRSKTDPSETLFGETLPEGTGKSPKIPDHVATVTPPEVLAAARLADDGHWAAKVARADAHGKSLGAVLVAYWIDKRTVDEPGVKPPRATPMNYGQAGHIVNRFLVGEIKLLDAFSKARRLVDCAFARECWPFKGEAGPVELASIAHRAVFDRLRGHLGERINGPVVRKSVDELDAERDARVTARYLASRRVG